MALRQVLRTFGLKVGSSSPGLFTGVNFLDKNAFVSLHPCVKMAIIELLEKLIKNTKAQSP